MTDLAGTKFSAYFLSNTVAVLWTPRAHQNISHSKAMVGRGLPTLRKLAGFAHLKSYSCERYVNILAITSTMSKEVHKAMTYSDGSVANIGDTVLIENGRVLATIKHFIKSRDQLAEWGVEEPGVMFESEPFALLFIADRLLKESPPERV
jgi:hypothetical protein